MEMAVHTCKNCGQVFEKNFCNACGQKVAHRLNVRHVLHEVFHVFTHADKGILAFIPKILLQPGVVALDYVEGRRKQYFNVFQYAVLVVGLLTFLMAKVDYLQVVSRSLNTDSNTSEYALRMKEVNAFIQKYFNFFSFALIPLIALVTKLIFRKKEFNYAEVCVLQTCIQAQYSTLSLLFLMPMFFSLSTSQYNIINVVSSVFGVIGQALAFKQFFGLSWGRSIWKGLLVYILFMLMIGILSGLVGLTIGGILMAKHEG